MSPYRAAKTLDHSDSLSDRRRQHHLANKDNWNNL
ncbi:hypothetical protein A2U01_0096959, partial [Trifolium medium]|nr:hypothetical protein [Trifolium medium]